MQEIALPTAPFESVEDLYKPFNEGFIEIENETGDTIKLKTYQKVKTNRGEIYAIDLKEGDEIWENM